MRRLGSTVRPREAWKTSTLTGLGARRSKSKRTPRPARQVGVGRRAGRLAVARQRVGQRVGRRGGALGAGGLGGVAGERDLADVAGLPGHVLRLDLAEQAREGAQGAVGEDEVAAPL